MHASTASACFRKLSDWVNSVSKPHADSRSFMVSYPFSPGFLWFISGFPKLFFVFIQISLDIHRLPPADYAADYKRTTKCALRDRLSSGHSQNLDGYDACPG